MGIAASAVLLAVYLATLMPGVPPTDSGEVTLAAWLAGVAHAPGFPLYTAVGWLWSHALPIGRVVWRLNLLSAVCTALAGGLLYALILHTWRGTGDRKGASLVAAATGALALGLGRTVWNWATVTEVYALNLALAAVILLLVVAWTGLPEYRQSPNPGAKEKLRDAPGKKQKSKRSSEQVLMPSVALRPRSGQAPRPRRRQLPSSMVNRPSSFSGQASPDRPSTFNLQRLTFNSSWPLIAAAFLFGLGLGNHLTSIALLAPAIAFWLTARRGWRFWISRTALFAALALALGVAIYLYLPLRAAADPLLNWGKPDTWQRFWWQVTARQYRVSLLSSPVGPQVLLAARLWWTQFTPVGLALLVAGAWRMARSQRMLFWMLALVIVFSTLYAWAYVIEDDQDAYYLPAFMAGAVWVAWGGSWLVGWLARFFSKGTGIVVGSKDRRSLWGNVVVVLSLLVLPLVALGMNWAASNRRADTIPEDYVRDTFAEIGPNGLLLTRDWQLYAPALYLQQVEGLRPDLAVIDTELLRRGWYFDLLHRLYPDLMASVAPEERAFLALRDAWERGDIPDGDPRIAQLQTSYVALLDAFIDRAAEAGHPVHAGPNRGADPIRDATLNGQPDMEPGIGGRWQWVPAGLTFRAIPVVETFQATSLQLQPLSWHVEPFARVVPTAPERKIQATRADMATLRGLVQANAGNLTGAEADWRLALTIDPAHGPARELLGRLKAKQ